MTTRKYSIRAAWMSAILLFVGMGSFLVLSVWAPPGEEASATVLAAQATDDPMSDGHENVRLVG